jgi:hypothetical protein
MPAKPSTDLCLRLILHEFQELWRGVILAEDLPPVRAMILFTCSDYRAHPIFARCRAHPSHVGACDRCGTVGDTVHSTTVYRDYHRWVGGR